MPLYMAGRFPRHGDTDDQRIWWSRTYDGNNWNGMNEVPNANSAAGPSLATWHDRLYMAYSGVYASGTEDRSMSWSSFDGDSWSPPLGILDREMRFNQTARRPVLISRPDRLHLYWAGHLDNFGNPDHKIYHATYDGQQWQSAGALLNGLPVSGNGIYLSNAHTADVYLLTREGDNIILYRSSDGYDFDVNNRTVLPHRCLGLPSFVGYPGFMTATLMVTYIKSARGGLFGSTSTDRGYTWGAEFAVTNFHGTQPDYGAWGSADPFAVWVGGDSRVYTGRPAAGSSWRDPATGNPLAPDQQPVYQLSSGTTPTLAAYGDILFP
ncbi:hypothetical protein [Nocardia blacklockiae]|uniref:hypothetical protein n=1 Tax=Nocardia blacklockiae TaxID=480036 RepID=UPI00189591B5|nr:hypothetical protein [Nocardia blacklockiae]MBF6175187.1 hypothetical protein [Nocardia blacklockiae]